MEVSSSMSIWMGVRVFVDVGNSVLMASMALCALAREREPTKMWYDSLEEL